jgi:hypothetical protein
VSENCTRVCPAASGDSGSRLLGVADAAQLSTDNRNADKPLLDLFMASKSFGIFVLVFKTNDYRRAINARIDSAVESMEKSM